MQLLRLFAVLVTGASVAFASPVSEPNTKLKARQYTYGECNGTSCRVGFSNFSCDVGKCTKQSGGGDGKSCWHDERDYKVYCPGRN
ncbi:hypothetical protein FPOA_12773 [Fusarium poae]|uniref:Antifungal protein n=1 Tax=Fusarium poae TaxID=36050 RepID=A0A1B8A807_FUSPO|nr:hypothetical protein FPOA_12773 [Fusarium poae]